MAQFEELGLWHRNIGDGMAPSKREQLRASYRQFWDNAVELSREIQRDLPQLTLHDDRHFEALWEDTEFDDHKKAAIYKFTNDLSHRTGKGFDPALVPRPRKTLPTFWR